MSGPEEKLVEVLETLPAPTRQEITAWLLGRTAPGPHGWLGPPELRAGSIASTFGSSLPAGEGSQLVTIRLPSDRHAELRAWCNKHGFTMAAVVRGLVERFLEEQNRQPGSSAA